MEYNGVTQIFACLECRDPLLIGVRDWRKAAHLKSNIFVWGFMALVIILAVVTGSAMNA